MSPKRAGGFSAAETARLDAAPGEAAMRK